MLQSLRPYDTSGIETNGIFMPEGAQTETPRRFTAKRERTRALLIDAAAELITEKGFHAASLREVAARAGLTKGAIYGIFDSKENLFLAVIEAKLPRRPKVFEPGLPLRAQMHRFARHLIEAAPAAAEHAPLAMELELYLIAHEDMRQRVGPDYSTGHLRLEAEILAAVAPEELPLPAGEFAILLMSLAGGVLHRRLILPEVMTDEVIVRLFEALAR